MSVLHLDVVTLFPEYFSALQDKGVTRRGFDLQLCELHCWSPRDFASDARRSVDDRPFGGGPGMVMLYQPLKLAIDAAKTARRQRGVNHSPVILLSPAGAALTQQRVQQFSESSGAIILCGRYEGVDQRLIDEHVDEQMSLGDFVLSGGEIAAMALFDAAIRLLPGVLHDEQSCVQESFQSGLLDCPHYTRPECVDQLEVPKVLLSGNHAEIAQWRRQQSLLLTARQRPDLLRTAALSRQEIDFLLAQTGIDLS